LASFYICLTNPPRAWLACRCISRQRRSRDRDPDFSREFAKTASPATITKSAVFLLELPGPHRVGGRVVASNRQSKTPAHIAHYHNAPIYIYIFIPAALSGHFFRLEEREAAQPRETISGKRYAPHDTLTGLLVLILTGPRWNQSMTVSLGCQVLGHAHCSAVLPRE